jgi:hypothetical protein
MVLNIQNKHSAFVAKAVVIFFPEMIAEALAPAAS